MFDTTPSQPRPLAPWQSTLSWGDIVAFRFPVAERPDSYRAKVRPCLVLDTVTLAGERFVTLAYGTSADTRANRGYEVRVTRPEVCQALGLSHPTRFVGARRVTVSIHHPGFVLGPLGTPVLARLTGAEFERMNAVRARIHAEADMAVERNAPRNPRRRRREQRRRSEEAGRSPVVVEHRRPRAIQRRQAAD